MHFFLHFLVIVCSGNMIYKTLHFVLRLISGKYSVCTYSQYNLDTRHHRKIAISVRYFR